MDDSAYKKNSKKGMCQVLEFWHPIFLHFLTQNVAVILDKHVAVIFGKRRQKKTFFSAQGFQNISETNIALLLFPKESFGN